MKIAFRLTCLIALSAGCTNTVIPPSNVKDPVTVYLLDHGRTSSLVLPRNDGTSVRWAYGHWNWYALGNKGPIDALNALVIPAKSTLGRRNIETPATEDAINQNVHVPIEAMYALVVNKERAQALISRLDKAYAQRSSIEVKNQPADLNFVRHRSIYWLLHNSNHVVSDWMRDLGCRIKGPEILSQWDLKSPVMN
jgi:hypothetical protein